MAFSLQSVSFISRAAPAGAHGSPRPAEYIARGSGGAAIYSVCSAGPGLAAWGQETSMGQGNLPRARARPHLPVMSNPVCPVGSQGLCATLAPALPPHPCLPVRLSTGMAKMPGWLQDRTPWHSLGVPGSISQVPLAAAPSVVPEVTGMCLSSSTQVCCPPASTAGRGTVLGMPRGSSGCALARTPREEAVCIPALAARAGWSCI